MRWEGDQGNAVLWRLREEKVSINRKELNCQMPLGWSGEVKTVNLPLNLAVWRSLVTLIAVVYGVGCLTG